MLAVGYLITARNEDPRALDRSPRSALDQSVPGQVVLVDDDSDPPVGTALPVDVIRPGRNVGISAARNLGLRAAAPSRFVAVFNCDVLLPVGWARACIDYLDEHAECAAVWTGLSHVSPHRAATWWLDCQELPVPPLGPTPFAPGHAVMFRRASLEAVGGYDAVNYPNVDEDHDVCRRLGASGLETHFIGSPSVLSLQDLSVREMARKDFTRMKIVDAGTTAQLRATAVKGARRCARHLLGLQWALIPRDLMVAAASAARAFQLRAGHR